MLVMRSHFRLCRPAMRAIPSFRRRRALPPHKVPAMLTEVAGLDVVGGDLRLHLRVRADRAGDDVADGRNLGLGAAELAGADLLPADSPRSPKL